MRKINEAGLSIIKTFEGCRLTVYLDIAGHKTVGYGHMNDLMVVGTVITQEAADSLLEDDLKAAECATMAQVKVPLSDNQYSALVSFVFNLGASTLIRSHLLRFLNNKDYVEAAKEFPKWDEASGNVVPGLLNRRLAEQALFNKEDSTNEV